MISIDLIGGARPNFVKLASVIKAIKEKQNDGTLIDYRFIHTGQHYSKSLSEDFFVQLNIPEPDINLNVGSGSHAEQTAKIMMGYEQILNHNKPDVCLVVGDVNSTVACAIVARKAEVPVVHVEGGIRSFDWSMPEEINRVLTDSITNWFFTTSTTASQNLINSGVDEKRIYFVGNTMVDTLLTHEPYLIKPALWNDLDLCEKNYLLLTMHRPSNVDAQEQLCELLSVINANSRNKKIIFPVHPRTEKVLGSLKNDYSNIFPVSALSYLEFNYLVKHAFGVLTDSGGITEETTMFHVPCLTLRENTERPETVTVGTNELVGTQPEKISSAMETLFSGNWKAGGIPDLWDGMAGERMVNILIDLLTKS